MMRKTNTLKIAISLLLFALIHPAHANPWENIYKNLENIKVADKIPSDAIQRILIVSNRYFEPGNEFTYARYVHPKKQMFWFVVSMTTDSSYITSYNSLEDAMQVFPEDRNFLIFVNGHGKNFGQVIGRGFEIGTRYNVNMIMFDWPTDYYALRKTVRNARKVTENFAITVRDMEPILNTDFPNSNFSVIFHSMGNHIARHLVRKEYIEDIPEKFFNNLILNAAAVKEKNHAEWVGKLNIQYRLYIVSNDMDLPLKGASILRMSKQLGLGYKAPLAENAYYVDFSNIADKEHNMFLGRTSVENENPNILIFYNTLFQGFEPKLTNDRSFLAGKNKIDFFFL
jgi:hypothetical protein